MWKYNYSVDPYSRDDELMHYGVLGMKWGVHKAKQYADKAKLAKKAGDTESAKKYQAKSDSIKQKHVSRTNEATYNRVSSSSTGKLVAQSYLMGTYGALKYNQARASGSSRGSAAVSGLLHNFGNTYTGGLLSVAEPRYRSGELTGTAHNIRQKING